ncbi:MAG TPA: sulfotransferase [Frateuria sp.]|uniref:sulfotransferase family protein n=1 Tax=Frateuria sp. TaxID=2211372 RepID=UPI002D800762|nr:sulfotransferase [Frateuria sp.]HET6806880.1 sulfotransferase [Frateuria sp.]
MTAKVFCIGFHKTGTTSLAVALQTLGYRVTGPNGVQDPDIATNVHRMAYELVEKYDAFQDNPWPIIYKDLDQRYPGSKFIFTVRETQSWINSQVKHFGTRETAMRKWIYGVGCPQGNEAIYTRVFDQHNREVLEHFRGRPDDLLVLDLPKGDGWDKLCPFLGKPVPGIPFPHANKATDRNDPLLVKLLKKGKRQLAGESVHSA